MSGMSYMIQGHSKRRTPISYLFPKTNCCTFQTGQVKWQFGNMHPVQSKAAQLKERAFPETAALSAPFP
jgi:hypothetical protein